MFPSPTFFPDAKMNFAASVFRKRNPAGIAVIEAKEGSLETKSVTWAELYNQVEQVAAAMRANGVKKGDRVAAVIATSRLAVALCLATLSIGAIWSSISPDFGTRGILDRVTQIDPKLIFTDVSVLYNGKARDLSQTILEWAPVASRGASIRQIIINSPNPDLANVPKGMGLGDFCLQGAGAKLTFESVPFSHPAFIFYSSGTVNLNTCFPGFLKIANSRVDRCSQVYLA